MILQPLPMLFFNKITNLLIWQIYSKVHISEKTFEIVKAFFLCVADSEVVVSVVINLPHILKSFTNCVLTTFQMIVYKWKTCIFKAKSYCYWALVSCHSRKTCFYFNFSNIFNFVLMLLVDEHYNEAANHHFLYNMNIFISQGILKYRLPQLCTLLVFSYDYFFCV